MRYFTIPKGVLILRYNEPRDEWTTVETTKEVTYTEYDVLELYDAAIQFTLPRIAWPYTIIDVNRSRILERPTI